MFAIKRKKKQALSRTQRMLNWVMFSIILVWSLSLLYSLCWMFFAAFKDTFEYYINPFGFPDLEFATLENYKTAFSKLYVTTYEGNTPRNVYFLELLFNSVYFTLVPAFLSIFVPCIAAYICTKYDFWFNKVLTGIVVVTLVLPIAPSLAGQLKLFRQLGIYDNLFGVFAMKYSFLGHNFLYMAGAFKGISNDYRDAAAIDGAGHFKIFFMIMLPLIKNVFMMFFMLQLISWWNTWDFTYIYMPSYPNLAQAVYNIQFSSDNQLAIRPVQLAVCTIVIIPALTFFLIFKNQIMQQVSFGGLKG
jgi:multiple sugar transport system permease protein